MIDYQEESKVSFQLTIHILFSYSVTSPPQVYGSAPKVRGGWKVDLWGGGVGVQGGM